MVAEDGKLLDGSRPVKVGGDKERRPTLGLEPAGEFGRRGGLPGTVESDHQDPGRLVQIERGCIAAKERAKFLMENFYDLLSGRDTAEDILAKGLFPDAGDKVLRHLKMHIRIQQGHAHLAQGVGHIGLADLSVAAEILENVLKFV